MNKIETMIALHLKNLYTEQYGTWITRLTSAYLASGFWLCPHFILATSIGWYHYAIDLSSLWKNNFTGLEQTSEKKESRHHNRAILYN